MIDSIAWAAVGIMSLFFYFAGAKLIILLVEIAGWASHIDLLNIPLVLVHVPLYYVPVLIMAGVFIPFLNIANIPKKLID